MSRSLSYTFPVANTQDVCLIQSVATNANFILNGNLANQVTGNVSFISLGYSRQISITSAFDNSGVTFVISGTQNGVAISENLIGPNNATVYSVLIYDVITAISATVAPATNAKVGTGYQGFFPLININLDRDVINYNLNTARITAASIHTTIYAAIANIYQNGSTYLSMMPANNNNKNLLQIKATAADDQFFFSVANDVEAYHSLLIYINGTVGEVANSIQVNFIQT